MVFIAHGKDAVDSNVDQIDQCDSVVFLQGDVSLGVVRTDRDVFRFHVLRHRSTGASDAHIGGQLAGAAGTCVEVAEVERIGAVGRRPVGNRNDGNAAYRVNTIGSKRSAQLSFVGHDQLAAVRAESHTVRQAANRDFLEVGCIALSIQPVESHHTVIGFRSGLHGNREQVAADGQSLYATSLESAVIHMCSHRGDGSACQIAGSGGVDQSSAGYATQAHALERGWRGGTVDGDECGLAFSMEGHDF